MKKLNYLVIFFFCFVSSLAIAAPTGHTQLNQVDPEISSTFKVNSLDDLMNLTPKKYKEMTGERMKIKDAIKLKLAQKAVAKMAPASSSDIPQGLYVVLVILGFGFIAMGLLDDWSGNNWWVNLILTALCWLPGVIHGLVKMKEYY